MFASLFNQKYRKMCRNAIKDYYKTDDVELWADRRGHTYYSIWRVQDFRVEVLADTKSLYLYEFTQSNKKW